MEPWMFSSTLWFTFGCICLWCLHRVVARICKATEICSTNDCEAWKIRGDIEHEKTKQTETTKQTHVIMKEREAAARQPINEA